MKLAPRIAAIPEMATEIARAMGRSADDVRVHVALSKALLTAVIYGALALRFARDSRDPVEVLEAIARAEESVDPARCVHIHVQRTEDGHAVSIRDPGEGFDWQTAAAAVIGPIDPLATGGRGLLTMLAGSEALSWNARGNEVVLHFAVPQEDVTRVDRRSPRRGGAVRAPDTQDARASAAHADAASARGEPPARRGVSNVVHQRGAAAPKKEEP